MSELEKVKAQINAIHEGLGFTLSRLDEIDEAWQQSGQIVANQNFLSQVAKEALSKTQPMKTRKGLWLWSRDAPELKDALKKSERKRLDVTVNGKAYTVTLSDGREEPDAFISFWPKKTEQ